MKTLILLNNISDKTNLNLAITKVKALCPFLDITIKDTTRQFTSIPFSNTTYDKGYLINPNDILDEEKKYGDFDIDILYYSWDKVSPKPTAPAENGDVVQIPIEWCGNNVDVIVEFTLHELCHELAWYYKKPDLTHNKYSYTDGRYNYITNTDYYLLLIKDLKPIISPKLPPVAILSRHSDNGVQTTGELQIGVSTSFATLERPWKDNKPNISCIPKGFYDVMWSFSFKFLKYTYEIKNVKGRSGIRIHSANYYSQLLGCIALGNSFKDINGDGQLDILNSRISVKKFEDMMERKPFKLQII